MLANGSVTDWKFLQVRWLSIHGCIESLIVSMPAVLAFLKEESTTSSTAPGIATTLYATLCSARTLLLLHGIQDLLETLQQLTKNLQHETLRYYCCMLCCCFVTMLTRSIVLL